MTSAQNTSRAGSRLACLPLTNRLTPVAPLLVRIVVGAVMIAHAGHFTPTEFAAIIDRRLGLPLSEPLAWGVIVMLYVGGPMFIVGVLSRVVAIPFMVHMTFATVLIDLHEGLAPRTVGGMQISLLLLVCSLVIYVRGPGPISIDNLLGWDCGWAEQTPERSPSA